MAKHEYVVNSKGPLILPMENGGTKRLSPGQIVKGPHFAKFVGKGLRPHVPVFPKPTPEQMPTPFQKAGQPPAEEKEEEPKGEEVARSKPKEEPPPAPEPEDEDEEPEEEDSLPQSKSELEKMLKEEVVNLAAELGLDTEGTKADVVKRVAKELGL
jgi:hypothetical protein